MTARPQVRDGARADAAADPPRWLDDGYGHIWMPYTQMETAPLPEAAVATEGSRIVLSDGRELVDGTSSWWSACHGYNHPHIADAVRRQLETMPHVMLGGLANEPALTLARRLAALAPGALERAFFSESGSVAVEVAMKMAAQYWLNRGEPGRTRFVCFEGAYHGDTIAAMSVGDPEDGIHGRFQNMMGGVMGGQPRSPLPRDEATLNRFEAVLDATAEQCAAVIVEPLVQGAGGMLFHDRETLRCIRAACDARGLLLIADEIMTGFGRLGTMFACDEATIAPDIMTVSKALTGGTLPLAATLATNDVFGAFSGDDIGLAFMHGPTFSGNALGCAAANASLDLFELEPRLDQVHAIEAHMKGALAPCRGMAGRWGSVKDVRVMGAIGVVEMDSITDMTGLRARFVEAGCWIRPFGRVVYLMPAFTIGTDDLRCLTDTVVQVLAETGP